MTSATKANLWGIFNTLAIIGMLQAATYLIWFEPPWLSYDNSPFPPVVATVHAGQPVRLIVARCNFASGPRVYTTSRTLVAIDGSHPPIILQGTTVSIDSGCTRSESRINVPPADTPPGLNKVVGYAQVEGTIRTSVVPWESQPFEVVR